MSAKTLGYWSQPPVDYAKMERDLTRERQALSAMQPEDNRSASQRMKEERQRIQFEDRGYYNL